MLDKYTLSTDINILPPREEFSDDREELVITQTLEPVDPPSEGHFSI